jgi:hypothetical protein
MTDMGGACSTYGGEEMCIQEYGGETLREVGHVEYTGVYGSIILKWIFVKWDGGGKVAGTGSMLPRIRTGGGLL